jgi:hypothetical protein
MKNFNFLSAVIAVVLMVAAVSCTCKAAATMTTITPPMTAVLQIEFMLTILIMVRLFWNEILIPEDITR